LNVSSIGWEGFLTGIFTVALPSLSVITVIRIGVGLGEGFFCAESRFPIVIPPLVGTSRAIVSSEFLLLKP